MALRRTVEVAARPTAVRFELDSVAVVVVDMQNDFGSSGGMFDLAGIDVAPIRQIVAPIRELLDVARRSDIPIIFLKMAFRPDLSDAGRPDSPTWLKHVPLRAGDAVTSPDGVASRILVRDTWNTDIIDELAPHPDDIVLYKHRFSGFYGTELEALLRERGINTIIVVGATTSVCVDSTVRDAVFRDIHCVVLEDCTAEPIGAALARSNHDATLLTLELLFAHITTSRSLSEAITASLVMIAE